MRVIQVSIIALALWLIAGTEVQRTAAGAPDDRPAIAVAERLATQSELDAVSLNIVDAKLALSLAVEVQIQIELAGNQEECWPARLEKRKRRSSAANRLRRPPGVAIAVRSSLAERVDSAT